MGLFSWLNSIDSAFLQNLNGNHTAFADGFWWAITDTISWLPLFLAIVYLILSGKGRESILILLFLALTVLLCDQLSGLIKDLVMRLRPSRDPSLMYNIHVVNGYRGGMYGFVSSHAANTFGVAMFLGLLVRYRWFSIMLFLWASLNSYSRIYLGVHFPFDILGGAALGILLGWLMYKGLQFMRLKIPALASISTERSYSSHTTSDFKKADTHMVIMVFFMTLFFFGLISTYVKDFMP